MKRTMTYLLMAVLAAVTISCSAALDKITGGETNLTTASDLWPDVPKMDGLAPSQMELPLYVKVLMRTALTQFTGEGKSSGDWIVFSTSKTPDDIKSYYTNERMTANGWEASDTSTCLNGSDQGIAQVGVFCVFEKQQGNTQSGLMIVAAKDDQTKQTNLLFVRVQTLATPEATRQG